MGERLVRDRTRGPFALAALAALVAAAIAAGYPIQRHYLENRYADPTFTTPGLNAAFKWAQGITDARIATTSTRQYPLFGRDLSNQVDYIGEEQPHGGFTAPSACRAWRPCSTPATTTTSSPAETASNPASPHIQPPPAGPKPQAQKWSYASRPRSSTS